MSDSNWIRLSSEEKRKLLLEALQKKAAQMEGPQPLSLFQEGLLVVSQLQPELDQYNMPFTFCLKGKCDYKALERSLQEVVKRHAPLRSVFIMEHEGQTRQIIQPFEPRPLPVIDVRGSVAKDVEIKHLIQQENKKPFSLTEGPLYRFRLYQLDEEEHWLLFVVHHVVFDGASLAVFLDEVGHLYHCFVNDIQPTLPEITYSYHQFARLQQKQMENGELANQLSYWEEQLRGSLPVLELPSDLSRPAVLSGRGNQYSIQVSEIITEGLKKLSQQEGSTLYMTLLAAYNTLLNRYTNQEDLLVGTAYSYRERKELLSLMGLLINTLVIRTDLSGSPTFRQLIQRVKETALDAFAHADFPFARLVEALKPDRSHGRTPLFQTMFAMETNPTESFDWHNLQVQLLSEFEGTAKFEITMVVKEEEKGLVVHIEYSTDLFTRSTIERLAEHYTNLLASIVENPDQPIAYLSYLSKQETDQLLVEWNETQRSFPQELCIHELVEQQALQNPHAWAVIEGEETLTYQQLNDQANQIARMLRQKGLGLETPVAVCAERSVQMIVGLLGILKAGGTYVPIDPSYPPDRISYMIRDTMAPVVLTQRKWTSRIQAEGLSTQIIYLDEEDWKMELGDDQGIDFLEVTLDHRAYIIYTSGSTGLPKGVEVTHRNLLHLIHWHNDTYQLTQVDRTSQLAGVGFDAAVWEIWPTLSVGASLYIAEEETRLSPVQLQQWLLANRITVSFVPTPLIEKLVHLPWPKSASLRYLLTGGDKLLHYPPCKLPFVLVNHYGPTEGTVVATVAKIPYVENPERVPTIGRPIANTKVYVLDSHMQIVPVGMIGELYISGFGLSRGYLHRPDLTEERFIPNPYSQDPKERLYKTGDLVRYLPDGNIEYIGRVDHQVKIRGYRMELGEIEAIISQFHQVEDVLVLVKERASEPILVAYVVNSDHASLDLHKLREFCKKKLPDYMVPSSFISLDSFPLTPNGKVDRKALPEPQEDQGVEQVILPTSLVEQQIASIWQQVLHKKTVGIHDNFFDLGGHSLLLVQVHHQLKQEFDTDLTLMDLFQYPTISDLARRINQKQDDKAHFASSTRLIEEEKSSDLNRDIAIVGMMSRVPGSYGIEAFWENLKNGVESIRRIRREELEEAGVDHSLYERPNYVPFQGVMEGGDLFDASFFQMSPREAEMIDPQQRVFLEAAWEALEHAGYDPDRYGRRIGIFAGSSLNTYLLNNLITNQEYLDVVGLYPIFMNNDKDSLTTRVAYKLNLKGPAVTIQTACSTSLVAIHMACQSLLHRDCEMALAGGVSIRSPLKEGYLYQEGEISSPTGQCRAFDEQAQGTVSGTGVGIVVLKRYSDAIRDRDQIYAVIKGSAINNDGSNKVGFTAPSIDGQTKVITQALQNARVHPDSISYIEAHGTGTILGDPIEMTALTKAYRMSGSTQKGTCAIGSVKTNIGHLDAAAGVTGLIKTSLALWNKQLPPSLHFENPNPKIDFANSPFYVNANLQEWTSDSEPRRAGVSALGVGGTNAHLIVEEAPLLKVTRNSRKKHLLVWSAKSVTALERTTENLLHHLKQEKAQSLADIAYTLQVGRKEWNHRRFLLVDDLEEAVQILEMKQHSKMMQRQTSTHPSVVFLFPGQGSQYTHMMKEIYETESGFRQHVDECAEILIPLLQLDVRNILFPEAGEEKDASEKLNQTWLTQPALFVMEYALAKLWQSWGIQPSTMLGHSIGEYVAACLAGVFTLRDALTLVVERGRLIQSCEMGDMLVISLPEHEVVSILPEGISLAAINSRFVTVVSGPREEIEQLHRQLEANEITCRRLHTSHAFHSQMMEPALEPYLEHVKKVQLATPQIPFLSNVTGTWITPQEATDPQYWVRHLRQTVRFAEGLEKLLAVDGQVLLEVGPGHTLSTLVRQHTLKNETHVILNTIRHPRQHQSDLEVLLSTLGNLWLAGVQIDWEQFSSEFEPRRVALPTYPFERKRYWMEAPQKMAHSLGGWTKEVAIAIEVESSPESTSTEYQDDQQREELTEIEMLVFQIWQEVLGIQSYCKEDQFFDLGGDSLMASRVMNRLRDILSIPLSLSLLFEAPTISSLAQEIENILMEQLNQSNQDA